MPTTRQLIDSLRSDFCPICKGHKRPDQTMCPADYRRLPAKLKRDLYNRVGDGYEEAIAASMDALGADTFHLPPASARSA